MKCRYQAITSQETQHYTHRDPTHPPTRDTTNIQTYMDRMDGRKETHQPPTYPTNNRTPHFRDLKLKRSEYTMAEFTSAGSASFVFPGEIIKSFSDKNREYRHVTLENELEVLLVSHPGTDKAACCCSVGVGQLQDPDDYPGLAHFLEHLLFMGTEEYPSENEYSEFLSKHGGFSNAYTATEKTVYYYDVLADHMEEALNRFSSFFKCPSFNAESTERELKAVNSENDKNLQSDPWRFQQLVKSLCREGHAYNKFGTGNTETLGGIRELSSDVEHRTAREACIAFHKKYYSSNVMKVCVYGQEDLNTLQMWAEKAFKGIVNIHCPAVQPVPDDPYEKAQLCKYLEYVPVKDLKACCVLFPLPTVEEPRIVTLGNNGASGATAHSGYGSNRKLPLYHSDPIRYINHLIGHEGEGSILYALKQKNWATGLSSYLYHQGSSFSIHCIRVEYTDAGADHLEDIVSCIFAYLGMVKAKHAHLSSQPTGTSTENLSWVAQESFDMTACAFRYKDEGDPSNLTVDIANDMHLYPIEHTLTSDKILYDITRTQELMMDLYLGGAGGRNYFSVENSFVIVEDQRFTGNTNMKEKWYGSNYNICDYNSKGDGKCFEKWSCAFENGGDWTGKVYMPRPNAYLPSDFSLKHEQKPQSKGRDVVLDDSNTPVMIEAIYPTVASYDAFTAKGAGAEGEVTPQQHSAVLWYQPDHCWGQPKCQLRVKLWVPHLVGTDASPMSFILGEMYVRVLDELLIEELYYASCAKLSGSASASRGSITLYVSGYSHKIRNLLDKVLDQMLIMAQGGSCSQLIFDRVKEKYLRDLHNQGKHADAHRHSTLGSTRCLVSPMFHPMEKLDALSYCDLSHFDTFCKDLIVQRNAKDSAHALGAHVECFFFGNLTIDEAKSIMYDTVLAKLNLKPLTPNVHVSPHIRYVALQRCHEYVYRQHSLSYHPDEPNSGIENIYMVQDIEQCTAFSAIAQRAGLDNDKGLSTLESNLLVAEALISLLAHTMHEAAFNQLRTVEQLGYIVHAGQGYMDQQVYLRIIIQSSVMDASRLNIRIEEFLRRWNRDFLCADDEDYSDIATADAAATAAERNESKVDTETEPEEREKLANLEQWEEYKSSLIDTMLEAFHSFRSEASSKFSNIDSCRYSFHNDYQHVKILDVLTFEEFKSFYNTYIRATNCESGMGMQRRKFTSQFFGKDTHFPERVGEKGEGIIDLVKDTVVKHIDSPPAFKATSSMQAAVFTRR